MEIKTNLLNGFSVGLVWVRLGKRPVGVSEAGRAWSEVGVGRVGTVRIAVSRG